MKRVQLDINPNILVWAKERARYSEGELAKKVGVSLEKYRQWERGDAGPTIRQLSKLVRVLNRSLQLFFMAEIPDEVEILAEMRRLPGSNLGEESPELAEQVDLAVQKRNVALRLFEDIGEVSPSLGIRANINQNPDDIAKLIRDLLDVTLDVQSGWKDEFMALREWRSALENIGVLLFQIPGVSTAEMRGFSLSLTPLPIIGYNSKDWPRGRIFTIFHELTHILLQESVLDSIGESWFHLEHEYEIERFCNLVAASTLVPIADIEDQAAMLSKTSGAEWHDPEISKLSSRYKVSRAVIVRRLRALDLISEPSFDRLRHQYEDNVPARPKQKGGDFYANKIAHVGTLIPQLAFRAYYQNQATVSDLSMLLGLKAKNLGELEQRVQGFTYGFRSK